MTRAVRLSVDGRVPVGDILSVRVASRLSQPAQCELTMPAAASQWPEGWALGARLAVTVTGHEQPLFDGEVTRVELARGADGGALVRVRGYDRLHRLRKRQQVRVFEDVTAVDVATALVSDLGLTVAADDEGPRFPRVTQHRQSDFDLLVELAGRIGRYPVLRGDVVHLVTLAGTGDPVSLHFGQSLVEARVSANLDRLATSYTALAWQALRAEPVSQQATAPRTGRRIALDPDPRAVGVPGERTLVDLPAGTDADVAALAQAALDASNGRAVTLDGVALGDPRLVAGTPVAVDGIAEAADGQYVLCHAVHTLDATGYTTAIGTEPPEPPVRSGAASLTLGRVTAVDDPDGLGRVRVAMAACADLDLGWLGVVCPGAGRGKGLVALPDVGDAVVVALPHGSPAEGLVLGSLYGTVEPPDPGVDGSAVRRWSLRTADGQSIVVDDAKHLLRLENRAGSYVELAPDLVRLHAATDLTIDAPGQAITMRASSIDFEHAVTGVV